MPINPARLTARMLTLALLGLCAAPIPAAHAQSYALVTLATFTGANGKIPGGLAFSPDGGTLYGVTVRGGANGCGTAFSLPVAGGPVTTLTSFAADGAGGSYPYSLMLSPDGAALYGITEYGGANGYGSVFSVPTAGGPVTALASFPNSPYTGPVGPLVLRGNTLYGATRGGGANSYGSVFSVPTAGGPITDVVSLTAGNAAPQGGLILVGGTLYGTSSGGGPNRGGTVFSVSPGGAFSTLATFTGPDYSGGYPASPGGALTASADGRTLYGATEFGGPGNNGNGYGTVYSVPAAGGTPTPLAAFSGTNGMSPGGGLVLAGGTLYGATIAETGISATLFSVPAAGGAVTTLATLSGTGVGSSAGLTLGPDGRTLYGTTPDGGAAGDGTVFVLLPAFAVSGAVSLQGVASGNLAQPLTFTLTPTGSTPGAATAQTVTLDASTGAFTLPAVPTGTYTLGVKGAKWLQRDVPIDTTGGSVTGLSVSLLGGDVNGDNQVSLQDLGALRRAYGSTPKSPNWDPAADLNCDGQVSLQDLGILRSNYGRVGDR